MIEPLLLIFIFFIQLSIIEQKTSKMCCVCGKEHDMPIWKRTMVCECGNIIDRDRNSAVNIMCRFLSQNAKWTGYQQFADNLRKTGLPIGNAPVGSPIHSLGRFTVAG